MIKVALLSKWHVHAKDYANQAIQNENVSINVVWDEDAQRGQNWANELEVPFEEHLETLLSTYDIDAVIVSTPTNLHKDIISLAAKYKKHIFTEKVLAFTVKDCTDILHIVKENKVNLMVSLPRLTESYYLYAQEVMDQALLGRLTTIRCRLAHNGAVPSEDSTYGWLPKHFFNSEECGGGALIDLGAHPIYLTNRLAGKAKALTARLQQTEGYEVDDNAVVMVEYDSGALGILETGFLSSSSPFQLELYGTEGTLLIEDEQIRLKSNKLGKGWIEPDPKPKSDPSPFDQWVDAILNEQKVTIGESDILGLTLINELARISHDQGRRVTTEETKFEVENI